ncbi:MAG: hypothetical protein DHS20C07_08310 [Methyloligella sp.]|nr:MAG: hypothetical protein DHS20C07_08310 [Methyloligella sp.]
MSSRPKRRPSDAKSITVVIVAKTTKLKKALENRKPLEKIITDFSFKKAAHETEEHDAPEMLL